MFGRSISVASLLLGLIVVTRADAGGKPVAATTAIGIATTTTPLQVPASTQLGGGAVARPAGGFYMELLNNATGDRYLAQTSAAGVASVVDSNADGYDYRNLRIDRDGNLYGETVPSSLPGPYGRLFKVSPDGTFTTLVSFDFSAHSSGYLVGNDAVQLPDGTYYGVATFDDADPLLYRVTADGQYSPICSLPQTAPLGAVPQLVAASDGSLYGIWTRFSYVFHLTSGCQYTELYHGGYSLNSILMGRDGNLYVTDGITYLSFPDLLPTRVFQVTPAGVETDLHLFASDTEQVWQPGSWWCADGHCAWMPGEWLPQWDARNVEGYTPYTLMQGADGYLYGATLFQGLNGYGTVFRMATDGSQFSTLWSPDAVAIINQDLSLDYNPIIGLLADANGNPAYLSDNFSPPGNLTQISLAAPLSTKVSFSVPQVKWGQPSVLSWSATGAQSCQLVSDVPGLRSGAVAASGSKKVYLYSNERRTPPSFTAGLQCTAADGSVSNAEASITLQ